MVEADYDDLLDFESSDRFDARQKAALRYTRAIVWDSSWADDETWEELHAQFTDPELVELGSFVALTLGQQKWIKTLQLGHREVLGDTTTGLATAARP